MSISVQNIIDYAVTDLYVDGGTTSDQITPSVQGRAINWALEEVWELCAEKNLDLYAFRERTISVVSGTQEYALDSDTFRVTNLQVRDGVAPNYTYIPILPLRDSRNHFDRRAVDPFFGAGVTFSSLFPYRWFESKQALVAGAWTRYITLEPVPATSFTAVYDGLREVTKVTVPSGNWTSPSTIYLDVPDNFDRSIALRVVKYCYMKNKSRVDEINGEIALADDRAIGLHRRGLQWQIPLKVVRSS